jgi:ATP-dependent DNA helicase RecQ
VKKAVQKGPGIIYGGTRKNCEHIAALVQNKLAIRAEAYHAGMEALSRISIQQQWITGKIPLVVATTAFGMGIDKADCRFVIHYQPAYSLEAYYQQAGRAGRDGLESYPILLFKKADAHRLAKLIKASYPNRRQLQQVYDAVCDTLHLAAGAELEEMQEISIDQLKKRTQFSSNIIRVSLRTLNHLNFMEKVDHVFSQIGILFTVAPDYLRNLIEEEENKQKAVFMDVLFRQFGDESFNSMKFIDSAYLIKKLNVQRNSLMNGLQVLQDHDHILQFKARGEFPLIRPVGTRLKKLPVSKKELEKHRDNLLQKLRYMVGYIQTEECREVYIRRYFGEKNAEPCGHCDNCLRSADKGDVQPTPQDIGALKKVISGEKSSLNQLKRKLKWKNEKLESTLSWLLRENRVEEENEVYSWKD